MNKFYFYNKIFIMSSFYEGEDSKIPFDLDDWVKVDLFTLKNVLTFIMNKVNKNSKINNELLDSNNELKKKMGELEKSMLEAKTDVDIIKVNTV